MPAKNAGPSSSPKRRDFFSNIFSFSLVATPAEILLEAAQSGVAWLAYECRKCSLCHGPPTIE